MVALSCVFLLFFLCDTVLQCAAVDTISSSEPLFPNQTLVSPSQIFELGFFTPNGSGNQYIGIWYKNMSPASSKVVWVANRDLPLRYDPNQLASLTIGSDGNLRLLDGDGNSVWSTNVSVKSNGSMAVLMDSGNFVVRDTSSGNTTWESFDHPCDTLLSGMKIGINVKTGEKRYFISWKTDTDPSSGTFSIGLTPEVPPQAFIWSGSARHWRSGQWDRSKFIGIQMDSRYLSGYSVEQDIQDGTTYFSFSTVDSYMFLSPKGSLEIVTREEQERDTEWEAPGSLCEVYGTCGPFGTCNLASNNMPVCWCLEGFHPKSEEEWKNGNWTRGCFRKNELQCREDLNTDDIESDYFSKLSGMKLPDESVYLTDIITDVDCENWCLANCSCIAYSFVDAIGCMVWSDELIDIPILARSGKDLFVRLSYREREDRTPNNGIKIAIILTTVSGIVILGTVMFSIWRWRANKKGARQVIKILKFSRIKDAPRSDLQGHIKKEFVKEQVSSELPMFDLKIILLATSNFNITNKLGQGGFGPVYKGRLHDGREVAVKRLSSSSGQGMEEFKNEIVLISKLQHRNLVKLIGCCVEGDEKIVVYEYLPNKSLDTFLFDSRRKGELTWEKRIDIVHGVARGLMYLHRDSSLRIIHRDLKASNILLDDKMNPKISDFGLARIFQATQDLVNTCRVVGTLGYMSPEYAMGGLFSEKSDVYSFGVLMLEIVSGRKNTSFCYLGRTLNLLSYTWELWREGRGIELLDEAISTGSVASELEVMKCIQIGLLCVQHHATDRPNMLSVVLMLSGESDIPNPKAPAFTSFMSTSDDEIQSRQESTQSVNTVTCTSVQGR